MLTEKKEVGELQQWWEKDRWMQELKRVHMICM